MFNINRKLSHFFAYDLNLNESVLEKYLQYINTELEYLDNIINKNIQLDIDYTDDINEENNKNEKDNLLLNIENITNEQI
jgi:hypothetical protein